MTKATDSPFLVSFDGSFRLRDAHTEPPRGAPGGKKAKELLKERVERLDELQRILYAHDNHAVLLIFQAMDAAGKDSTIRAVLSGVDPAGCQVYSFKSPSTEELDHDFLWRTTKALPERGRIGVFNRSYYEEVITVRVQPELLKAQRVPDASRSIWAQRYDSIRDHERHLARNGTVILKFWLNVSREEQRRRLLSRLEEPEKNWKFNTGDLEVRARWDEHMRAYQDALNATSRPWAPWYAIPADEKPYMRMAVADILVRTLGRLGLRYPAVGRAERKRFVEMRRRLKND